MGFDAALLDRAADVRTRVWGATTEVNRDYLVWKYTRNPYFAEPLVQFAVYEDDVVGMYGSMGTCWELRGDRYVLGHGGDFLVDPRFRRQGVARRLQQAYIAALRARGLGIAFSFSGGSMGTATAVAGGWHVVAMLDALEWAKGRWPLVVAQASRRGHRLIRRMRTPAVNPLSTVTGTEDGQVELLGRDGFDRMARVASLAPTTERLRHVRDDEYFRWRLANPLSRYRVLASQNSYVVLQSSKPGSQVNLVDWRAVDAPSLASVLSVALRQIRSLRVWGFSVDPELRSVLESFGSVVAVRGPSPSFTMRAVTDDPQGAYLAGLKLNEPLSWEPRMLDSDEF